MKKNETGRIRFAYFPKAAREWLCLESLHKLSAGPQNNEEVLGTGRFWV